ncbi:MULTISPECIES: hypothetical protein [unclassified Chryseobacterium]|uniref:hypothetical protein n=1 Tax=unclassified Chryseobacterium TaxID=2593645 RepID=UPI00226A7742|nr:MULTISPECIES: hypothetical protein [unclassified Chryseobacterium]
MVKEIKADLKNMMTNSFIILFILMANILNAQKKIIQDFNSDKIKDVLIYKCFKYETNLDTPYCKIDIQLGKVKKKYTFNLEYIGDPIIDQCGDGCISLYSWTKDTEYTEEYIYSKKYDDWILTTDEQLLKYENNKIESMLPKDHLLGISGKEYPHEKKYKKSRKRMTK